MFSNAQAYERFMGRWSQQVAPVFAEFAGVPEMGRVLDLGSGTGSLAREIARRKPGIRVTGIDLSPEYVGYANGGDTFAGRVVFFAGDAQRMDFPDATFSAALSLLAFNFIPDAPKALEEARRVTQAGGRIAAAVWDYGGQMGMLREFWDAAREIDRTAELFDEKKMPLCQSGELSRLWARGGMKNVCEEPLEIEMRFGSFADFWEPFLLGQGPAGSYVLKLDQDWLERLRAVLRQRVAPQSEDEAFALPARVWAVRGDVSAA